MNIMISLGASLFAVSVLLLLLMAINGLRRQQASSIASSVSLKLSGYASVAVWIANSLITSLMRSTRLPMQHGDPWGRVRACTLQSIDAVRCPCFYRVSR